MNQVTEMLRLTPGASVGDAVIRLSTLFDLMTRADGFRGAEILRKLDEPDLLLVLHSWDDIQDWHAFRCSDTKMTFAAGRPDFLYQFMPCGINWTPQEGEGSFEGDFLRRELVQAEIGPNAGAGVLASQTFSYRDYDPAWQGVTLRLSRYDRAPRPLPAAGAVLADEVYESVKKHAMEGARARVAP
jgi:heme-degrading monooxygenase HmoA